MVNKTTYGNLERVARDAARALKEPDWGMGFVDPFILQHWISLAADMSAYFLNTAPAVAAAWLDLRVAVTKYVTEQKPAYEKTRGSGETFYIHAVFLGRFSAFIDLKDDPSHGAFYNEHLRVRLRQIAESLQEHVSNRADVISTRYDDFWNAA